MSTQKQKIIVILGTTASGKTSLGVRLAHKFNGEIISSDSRQVYKGMDVGTGKDLNEYKFEIRNSKSETNSKLINSKYKRIVYHLIDVANPKKIFSLADYQKFAYRAIDDILKRGKLPIIVGGTGLYLQALVDGYKLTNVRPDKKLRAKLEKKNLSELLRILKKYDLKKWKALNKSEKGNKRRLIRYIEIAKNKGSKTVQKLLICHAEFISASKLKTRILKQVQDDNFQTAPKSLNSKYEFLLIGVTYPKKVLEKRIYKRLIERLEKENMIGEVKRLHKNGLSWKKLESFGLEYKYISLYLQKKLSYDEMVEKLFIAIRQFAKRQITWFKRWEKMGAGINWIYPVKSSKAGARQGEQFNRVKNKRGVEKLTEKFLKQK